MKSKIHTYGCPHECSMCKTGESRLFINAWENGFCIVCGKDRNGNTWSCNKCWNTLTPEEQNEISLIDHGYA